jgi:uncharacterized protein
MTKQIRGPGGVVVALGMAMTLGLAVPAGADAQAPAAGMAAERTIRVTGVGEARVRPDQAQVAFAVETVAATAQAAGRENARVMDRVIAALVQAGIPRADLETRGYGLHPEYAHDEPRREPRIRGYRATNRVLLRTQQLERVGEFIDIALNSGANRMEGISFGLRDPQAAETAALRAAVERGRASAQTIADALGVQLGTVLDASTTAEVIRPFPVMMDQSMLRMEAAQAAPPTPVEPGEQTVRAQITLIYQIVQR